VAGLGPSLARALAARGPDRPIDVWTVENSDVAPVLRAAVHAAARDRGLALPPVGFAGAIAFAAVAQGDWKASPHPEFVGDACRWLLVDKARLIGPLPRLPRVGATDRYHEHLRAKRLVFSAGHAVCAFLGLPRGHRFVHEAAADPLIRQAVARSLTDARRALSGVLERDSGPVEWALQRYADAELRDPLERVARDPIRKLSPQGPLVEPARLATRVTGRVPAGFAAAMVNALLHRPPGDAQGSRLAEMLACADGLEEVLQDVCGLDLAEPLAREVTRRYRRVTGTDRVRRRPPRAALAAA
jgi:mannitol-1-phosphate 5-dehydrogenase